MQENNGGTEDERSLIEENIEEFGCHISLLEPTNYLPGFAYSIGLYTRFSHPEIICFGLKTDLLGALINHACDLIMKGETFGPGKTYSGFISNYEVQFLLVDKGYYANYLGYGGWFYGMNFDFPALQLVWPDKQSRFPWDEEFNPNWKFKQPLLDRNIDFKFYESKKLGVFACSQVLNGEPILLVHHNIDGTWQFHGSSAADIYEVKLVSLEQITQRDVSVNEIFHLEYGCRAWRESVSDIWEYTTADGNESE